MSRGIDEHAELYADTMDSHSAQNCIDWLERKIEEDRIVVLSLQDNDLTEYVPLFQDEIARRQALIERLRLRRTECR